MTKNISEREMRSAVMILINYCIDRKAQSVNIDDKFKDYKFNIDFKINEVSNFKTNEKLILSNSQEFAEELKPEILSKEKIIDGKVVEKNIKTNI